MLTITKADKIKRMDNNESATTNGKPEATELVKWLQEQLNLRNWTASDLADQAGVGPSTITRILTGERKAGPDVCTRIAQALGEEPDKVFRLAGLLPGQKSEARELSDFEEELLGLIRELPDDQREFILETVKGLVTRRAARRQ